jgi:hypothetical protein
MSEIFCPTILALSSASDCLAYLHCRYTLELELLINFRSASRRPVNLIRLPLKYQFLPNTEGQPSFLALMA